MRIHDYIEQQITRKSLGIYFRKGRWLLHILFLLMFWVPSVVKLIDAEPDWTSRQLLVALTLSLPFVVFFYFYCLYLIPYCFKKNRYQKFWILLITLLVLFPIISFFLQEWGRSRLPCLDGKLHQQRVWFTLGKVYLNFITSFIGFTSLLFFMELLEEVSLHKETGFNQYQLTATELHRIKTQMNPEFMMRSLDGIIGLSEQEHSSAPEAVIDFSDILRYRLYRSRERLVSFSEEQQQLSNLFRFHNRVPGQEHTAVLEIEGDTTEVMIVPLSLINIAEPLLATFHTGASWSVLLYLLLEEKEIQVAVELSTDTGEEIPAEVQRIQQDLQRLLHTALNFTVEKDQNIYSLRTCIPILRNSTAS